MKLISSWINQNSTSTQSRADSSEQMWKQPVVCLDKFGKYQQLALNNVDDNWQAPLIKDGNERKQ